MSLISSFFESKAKNKIKTGLAKGAGVSFISNKARSDLELTVPFSFLLLVANLFTFLGVNYVTHGGFSTDFNNYDCLSIVVAVLTHSYTWYRIQIMATITRVVRGYFHSPRTLSEA